MTINIHKCSCSKVSLTLLFLWPVVSVFLVIRSQVECCQLWKNSCSATKASGASGVDVVLTRYRPVENKTKQNTLTWSWWPFYGTDTQHIFYHRITKKKKKKLLNSNRIYVCKILVCISGIYRQGIIWNIFQIWIYNAHSYKYKEKCLSWLVSTYLFILSHISPAALYPSLHQIFICRQTNLHLYETIKLY